MKVEEFEKIKAAYLKKCKKVVRGCFKNENDLKEANFNGVYIILDENDEVIYIGSAYTNKFTIMNRLKIHLKGHPSNATIVNYLEKNIGLERSKAMQELYNKYKFVAYKYDSMEYKLIENVDGLYNSKGNKR